MSNLIHSYPTVFAIGHKMIADLFNGPVVVEEKVDGSQFSFGAVDGELVCRSKGQQIIVDAPEKMFERAVQTAIECAPAMRPEWVYRCEYLSRPKHNTLAYSRVPVNHLIVFDIQTGLEEYITPEDKRVEAARLGLECVPLMARAEINSLEAFNEFLERESVLGGTKVEGVVIKNYAVFTTEKKIAIGKYVSEAFKEVHSGEWRKNNPTSKDIAQQLIDRYRTEARWQKAVQHLRDADRLEGSPRDIGPLMKEVPEDILKECEQEIRDMLFTHFWPQIRRGVAAGFPEWYKQQLASNAFPSEKE